MMKMKIANLKIQLYYLLLKKPPKEITDTEINIRYELSKDPDIQRLLLPTK